MRESMAIGFWARHCWAMEALHHDEDDFPGALAEVRSDETVAALINVIVDAAFDDVDTLLVDTAAVIDAELGRKTSPFKVVKKRSADAWTINLELVPRRGGMAKAPFQVVAEVRPVVMTQ
jgi:hypothetical protein